MNLAARESSAASARATEPDGAERAAPPPDAGEHERESTAATIEPSPVEAPLLASPPISAAAEPTQAAQPPSPARRRGYGHIGSVSERRDVVVVNVLRNRIQLARLLSERNCKLLCICHSRRFQKTQV